MKHYLKIFFILLIFFCPLFGLYAQDNPKKYKTYDGKDWDGKLFNEEDRKYTVYLPQYNITVKTALTDSRGLMYQSEMEQLKKSKDAYFEYGRLGEKRISYNKYSLRQISDIVYFVFAIIIVMFFIAMCIYVAISKDDDDESVENKDNKSNTIPQDIQEEIMVCLYIIQRLNIIYTHIKDSPLSTPLLNWVWKQVAETKSVLQDKKDFIPEAFSELSEEILSKFKTYTAGCVLDFFDDEKFYKHIMILAEIHIISLKGHLPKIPPQKRSEVISYIEKQKEVFANFKKSI